MWNVYVKIEACDYVTQSTAEPFLYFCVFLVLSWYVLWYVFHK